MIPRMYVARAESATVQGPTAVTVKLDLGTLHRTVIVRGPDGPKVHKTLIGLADIARGAKWGLHPGYELPIFAGSETWETSNQLCKDVWLAIRAALDSERADTWEKQLRAVTVAHYFYAIGVSVDRAIVEGVSIEALREMGQQLHENLPPGLDTFPMRDEGDEL